MSRIKDILLTCCDMEKMTLTIPLPELVVPEAVKMFRGDYTSGSV